MNHLSKPGIIRGTTDLWLLSTSNDRLKHHSKEKTTENLRDGYLLKDILEQDNLKDSLFVFHLLRLIAFQIGHDVSYAELVISQFSS